MDFAFTPEQEDLRAAVRRLLAASKGPLWTKMAGELGLPALAIPVEHGGFGAEIAARVHETDAATLRAPVARLGAPFVPVPAAPELEALFVPSAARIAHAVRRLVATAAP